MTRIVAGSVAMVFVLRPPRRARPRRRRRERASSPQFRVGQVWRYQTRPGEGASRVIIGRIERIEGIGKVVHVEAHGR